MAQTKSSLSSVVSSLVRSSMGTSVSSTVTDEDLDRHVAELILKEAKQKAEKYGRDGIKAYLPQHGWSESNVPKTNKRFLSNIIRSTDDHNKTILRAQAEAAEELRLERREQERQERRARAAEATEAERLRRLLGSSGSTRWAHNWERNDSGKKDRRKRERSWERPEEHSDYAKERKSVRRHRRRSSSHSAERHHKSDRRSPSPQRAKEYELQHKHRREKERRGSTSVEERHRKRYRQDERRGRSRSPVHRETPSSHRKCHISIKPDQSLSRVSPPPGFKPRSHSHSMLVEEPSEYGDHSLSSVMLTRDSAGDKESSRTTTSAKARLPFPSPTRQTPSTELSQSGSSSTAKSTSTSPILPAFSPPPRGRKRRNSRPRSPLSSPPPLPPDLPSKMDKYFAASYDPRFDVAPLIVPEVPKTGLISDAEFAGWDAMLELLRVRREDKAEKKRLERLGISDMDMKRTGSSSVADRWGDTSGGLNIMEIEYKKKGSVREWDLGKAGF